MYAYDLMHGFWMKEEDGQMAAITNKDLDLYFIKGGALKKTGSSVDTALEWVGEMVETTEGMLSRKGYIKLIVRLDLYPSSTLKIYAKEDRRAYRKIWEESRGVSDTNNPVTVVVPIRLGRCDRWQLKLEGVGEVTIMAIGRDHVTGSAK